MKMATRRRPLLFLLASCVAASPSPRLALLPALKSRATEPQALLKNDASSSYSVVAALNADASAALNRLFGACFPLEDGEIRHGERHFLHADFCAPAMNGAPSLLLLAAQQAPLAALALADVWVAALPSGGSKSAADALLEQVIDALTQLPPQQPGSWFRQLLVVTDGGDEDEATTASSLQSRLGELWKSRGHRGAIPDVYVSVGSLRGPELLGRFAQPAKPNALLSSTGGLCMQNGVPMAEVPALLEELLSILDAPPLAQSARISSGSSSEEEEDAEVVAAAPLANNPERAKPGEWSSLVRGESAKRLAREGAAAACMSLREVLREATVNPVDGAEFSERCEALLMKALATFDEKAARVGGRGSADSLALQAKRMELNRYILSQLLLLTKTEYKALSDDALESFRADLALLLAESKSYKRHARRLVSKCGRKFDKAARMATPKSLTLTSDSAVASASKAAATSLRRHSEALLTAMRKEAGDHEEEAEALPPREQDSGPAPWWKQILAQVIALGLNIGQAYLLQHLPARRRDRLDEQAMPRAPLF